MGSAACAADNELPRAETRAPAVSLTSNLEPAVTRSLRHPDASGAPTPDHHLWRNGRVWWIAFTFHTDQGKKHRVRRSLGTPALAEARARRDALLEQYARRPGWSLALRFVSRRASGPGPCELFRARPASA